MQYTRLGSTGLQVSRICLGTMSFGNSEEWMVEIDKARPIVKRAVDLGVNFFDTANLYSNGRSEEIVGELLKGHRDDVVIATKVRFKVGEGPNKEGLSRYHILQQVRKSLKRLQTDRIDLYQIHRWDYSTPIEETLLALNDLVRQGTVGYIGASSMWAWQFAKALFTSDDLGIVRFVSMQNHYNLCYREEEREMIPLCKDQGIGLIPWSPLARGFLTGRYKRGRAPSTSRYKTDKYFAERFFRPEDFDVVERAEEIAKEKGVTAAQIALAWLLHKGVNAPIIGATKVEHIDEAVGSVDIQLSDVEMAKLEEPYQIHRILGHS
ncbi:aldo/keto reductase [Candidatus Bathyarchaeota archaeon]|nr:MAG: aldo/keto reductase [Candidatus Bathyarchaeota archaeon]TMI53914.1 MAG: aldo/keto reductase [Candidatus Bathyarchaeota archaeon]